MKRVALKGLAARPVRTVLTTLAIVLGVAMVSGAFTLTDTMRNGADSLSSAAYDGTDAVVTAKTAFEVESDDWTIAPPDRRRGRARRSVRDVPQVGVAVGDISDEAKIIGRDGKPVGDGPYFGVGYDSRTQGAEQTTPFRLDSGRWATGPGRGRDRRRHRREASDYALGSSVQRHHAAARRASSRSSASPASARSSRSASPPPRCSTCAPRRSCSTSRAATTRSWSPAATASLAADVRAAVGDGGRLGRRRSRPPPPRTASRSTA